MAEEETTSGATSAKVKFLCSHGGKIMLRPSDGHLKYVGGETRVICVPRNISFSDLMEKIRNLFEGEFILKYQIGSEELDALVSVRSDEDLHHMLDEYDRVERGGASKLRAFLFPAKLIISEIHSPIYLMPESLEQRFVDAVNGVVHPTNAKTLASTSRLKPPSSSHSECTSPRSPSPHAYNSSMHYDQATFANTFQGGGLTRMNKVHSSPSLSSLANQNSQPSNNGHNIQHQRSHHPSHQSHHQHQHHHHQHQQHHSGHHPFGKPPEHHGGQPWTATGRDGFVRVPSMSHLAPVSHQSSAHSAAQFVKGYPGNGGHNRWVQVGKPPVAYGDGSVRGGDVSPTPSSHRGGIIWE